MKEENNIQLLSISIKNMSTLRVLEYHFDDCDKLVLKGGAMQGKTTAQNAIASATAYGRSIQSIMKRYPDGYLIEGWMQDNNIKVKVEVRGVNGTPEYKLSATDAEGLTVNEIDGVPLTAQKYLSLFYDPLKIGTESFCSQDPATQRKFSLKLFSTQLETLSISQKRKEYEELVVNMQDLDHARKRVGEGVEGTRTWLCENGIETEINSCPIDLIDINSIEKKIFALEFEKKVIQDAPLEHKNKELKEIEHSGREAILRAGEFNVKIREKNREEDEKSTRHHQRREEITLHLNHALVGLERLCNATGITEEVKTEVGRKLSNLTQNARNSVFIGSPKKLIAMKPGEDGVETIDTEQDTYGLSQEGKSIISLTKELREKYLSVIEKIDFLQNSGTSSGYRKEDCKKIDKKLKEKGDEKIRIRRNNLTRTAWLVFSTWREAKNEVRKKLSEINLLYSHINTGVEGLYFCFSEKDNNVNLYYSGTADPAFFQCEGEAKRICDFSTSARALICLFLQIARLKKTGKQVAVCHFDENICKKTYAIALEFSEKMGIKTKLIISNTGDFNVSELGHGEVLLEGGEVFFNPDSNC